MKQYQELLKTIKSKGVIKPAAREGMPNTTSRFGYQFRHDLSEGFPLLTTKKVNFKNIVVELLWFLKGDTNIKYLVDNGCNIWNEDAYNYYIKLMKQQNIIDNALCYESFVKFVKLDPSEYTDEDNVNLPDCLPQNYELGDCGFQYGKVWRDWPKFIGNNGNALYYNNVDQIKNVINSLLKTPESRRHIVTAWDPAHDQDLALTWCHALFQFNCRPIPYEQRIEHLADHHENIIGGITDEEALIEANTPKYYLDCQLYQRSADVFLGVPYNLASYSLLIHIIAEMCNMVPGEFVHTFGDVHIYENHMDQVNEQLSREPKPLPKLKLSESFKNHIVQWSIGDVWTTSEMLETLEPEWFTVENYNPHPAIKGKLSTGLK